LPALVCAAGVVLTSGVRTQAQVVVDDIAEPRGAKESDGVPEIGEVPDGTPAELMEFIDGLRTKNFRPTSREQAMAFFQKVATTSVTVAEKILDQSKPGDDYYGPASKLKLESLTMLGQLGDQQAATAAADYAESLVDSDDKSLAEEARKLVLVADARKVFSTGDVEGAGKLVGRLGAMLEANPDDAMAVGLAAQVAGAIDHMPGGEDVARSAYETFGAAFAKSSNPQVKEMAKSFAGMLRRLSLPGNEMEITGTNLDGTPFDQKTLAGKVVLVDFWATWCGPCVAEIPNVLEQYEKYHDQGFEVVGISLDEDREVLEKFVAEQKIPWPILYEKPQGEGWRHPLSTFYGISGIPTVILIGRDGNVITLNARGEKLGEQLDKLFAGGK
jgi:thiol-disulfide isomerase/thioredoxin